MEAGFLFVLSLALCVIMFYFILKGDGKKNSDGAGGVKPEQRDGNEQHVNDRPDDQDHDGMAMAY